MGMLKRLSLTQIKALFYSIIGVVGSIIAFVVAYCGLHETVFYAICWGILFGGLAVTICRTALHCYLGEATDPEMWSVSFSMLAICGGWLGCILCNSYGWLFFWIAEICFFLIMGLGLRFIAQKEAKKEDPVDLLENLKATVRYRFVDNDIEKGENEEFPLCQNAGVNYTVNEAFDEGYGALAATGLEYLKAVVKAAVEKMEDEE